MLLDIVAVKVLKNYFLKLTFENNEVRYFDFKPLMNEKPFNKISEEVVFKLAKIENGTVVWPGEIDIAPETLYDRSTLMLPIEFRALE